MRITAPRSPRTLLVLLPLMAACASAGTPRAAQTPAERYAAVMDSLQSAGGSERREAPRIRLAVLPQSSSQFVDAAFHVSDDAYAFVAVVDLDRRVRVLYPESPADAGFVQGSRQNRLSRFFAGFGNTSFIGSRYRLASYSAALSRITPYEGGGVMIAIASDRPLQLERLADDDGDWNYDAIEDLVNYNTVSAGANAVGRAVSITGQSFSTDVEPISGYGPRLNPAFAGGCLNGMADYSAYGWDDGRSDGYGYDAGYSGLIPVGQYLVGEQQFVRFMQRDACGRVTYVDIPQVPLRQRGDTTSRGARPVPWIPAAASDRVPSQLHASTRPHDWTTDALRPDARPRDAEWRAAATDRPRSTPAEPRQHDRPAPRDDSAWHHGVDRPAEAPRPVAAPAPAPAAPRPERLPVSPR